jgi:hypothetical protein
MRGIFQGASAPRPNLAARLAEWLIRTAHPRSPRLRWAFVIGLIVAWLATGLTGWIVAEGKPLADALYSVLGTLTVQGSVEGAVEDGRSPLVQWSRWFGVSIPLVGVLFTFWRQVLEGLATLFLHFAHHHVVVVGPSDAAVTLARSVAADPNRTGVLLHPGLAEAEVRALRARGVAVVDGDGLDERVLLKAGADDASDVVLMSDSDADNLAGVDAARKAAARKRRGRLPTIHLRLETPELLVEAREFRSLLRAPESGQETRPFSLEEIVARRFLRTCVLLDDAARLNHERVHVAIVGAGLRAQAVARACLLNLWSIHFSRDPRVSVLCADPDAERARFRHDHPEAVRHGVWQADIDFLRFDWRAGGASERMAEALASGDQAPVSAFVVCLPDDTDSTACALSMRRGFMSAGAFGNVRLHVRQGRASALAAALRGDPRAAATLNVFGALEQSATVGDMVGAEIDRAAVAVHKNYLRGENDRAIGAEMARLRMAQPGLRESRARIEATRVVQQRANRLDALDNLAHGQPRQGEEQEMAELRNLVGGANPGHERAPWETLGEPMRRASRAAADHAVVKLWDAGWRAAPEGGRGGDPVLPADPAIVDRMARREHDRWMAERLMQGWRPPQRDPVTGEAVEGRDNTRRIHPDLQPWEGLRPANHERDAVQVRAAFAEVARAISPAGFVRDPALPGAGT